MSQKKATLEIEGRDVRLSNLDKVMYPGVGFTKGQVIDYYTRVAPYLLPHLKDRPSPNNFRRSSSRRGPPVFSIALVATLASPAASTMSIP